MQLRTQINKQEMWRGRQPEQAIAQQSCPP